MSWIVDHVPKSFLLLPSSCYIDEKIRRLCEIIFNFDSPSSSVHKYNHWKFSWQYFITLTCCYLVSPTALQQQVTFSFHFNLSLVILGLQYQNVPLLCSSSFTVAKSSLVLLHVSFHNGLFGPWQYLLIDSP